jgi:hypothetical protein
MALRFGSCKRLALHIWLFAGGDMIITRNCLTRMSVRPLNFRRSARIREKFKAFVNAGVAAV